jgi:anti-sigma factor RsiW
MTRPMIFDDPLLLVNAYLDGELDPASALGVEQRMAADPALAVEFARLEALRRLLREQLPRQAVPPVLPARIEVSAGMHRARVQPYWRALVASVADRDWVERASPRS